MKDIIKQRLQETFTKEEKDDIEALVLKSLKSTDVKDIIATIVAKEIKGSPELEKEVVNITKNVMTQFHKTIWVKRNFWQSALKNQKA